MESKPTNVEELLQKLKDYADVRIDLFKLKGIDKVSGFMSSVVMMVSISIIFGTVFLCITIGLALWIGSLLSHPYLGFFIMGALYLIIGLVLYSNRSKLIKEKVSNSLIKELID
jgi:phosphoglycerol transferase MdoB-like AlkP superfamily enzyme